jgi:nucleoside-diphosphate-sugar epimerase
MIALTTPTGKIGSQVLKNLLEADADVRVIARNPAKLAPELHERAEIVQGSMDDEQVLTRAFQGACRRRNHACSSGTSRPSSLARPSTSTVARSFTKHQQRQTKTCTQQNFP